jgi:hypothetical protein
MIEEAMRDPISVSMLKVDGKKIMEILGIPPGPKIGYILNALLGEVLENPKLNDLDYLSDRTVALAKIEENELISLAEKGKTEKDDKNTEEIKDLRKKHRV